MRKFILSALLALGIPPILFSQEAAPKTEAKPAPAKVKMTLDEAKKITLEANPSLAIAKARIESAIASVKQAEAAFWPTLDFNANATRLRDQATRPDKDWDNTTSYTIGASANWLLFDGFQRKFALLSAQYNLNTAEESDKNARRLLLQAVSTAFYSALLSQDNMNIAKEDADFNKILLDDAKKRQEGGVAKPSEVLNFILQVQNAEVDYITAEKNWRVSIIALGALLAITRDDIWDSIELVPPATGVSQIPNFAELFEYAKQNRPDLRSIEEKINISREGIEAAKNTWYPTVNLFANYGFERTHSIDYNKDIDRNITYGIAATWNVFNGGKTTAQIQQAEAELKSAIKERDDTLIAIDTEIRQNILAHDSSKKQLELQEAVLATAKKIRDLVHEEYLGGTATITRLNEVQTDVTIASSARSAAYIQLLNSIEALRASTGQNLEVK